MKYESLKTHVTGLRMATEMILNVPPASLATRQTMRFLRREMNACLSPNETLDRDRLLENWSHVLPDRFSVIMINAFGDLFIETETGAVSLLDINAGSLTRLAGTHAEFLKKLAQSENAAAWLYLPLVDALLSRGVVCSPGRCYAFNRPPVLGGDYHPDNVHTADFAGHLAFTGDLAEQLLDVGDGMEVEIKVRAGEFAGCGKTDCCSSDGKPGPGECQNKPGALTV